MRYVSPFLAGAARPSPSALRARPPMLARRIVAGGDEDAASEAPGRDARPGDDQPDDVREVRNRYASGAEEGDDEDDDFVDVESGAPGP